MYFRSQDLQYLVCVACFLWKVLYCTALPASQESPSLLFRPKTQYDFLFLIYGHFGINFASRGQYK